MGSNFFRNSSHLQCRGGRKRWRWKRGREGGRHHFAFSRVHFRLPPFPKTLANRYEKRHLKGEGKREEAEKAIKRGRRNKLAAEVEITIELPFCAFGGGAKYFASFRKKKKRKYNIRFCVENHIWEISLGGGCAKTMG